MDRDPRARAAPGDTRAGTSTPRIGRPSPPGADARRFFVGRDAELEHLLAGVRLAGEGRGRVLLISGEPGIGKSRLADEVARSAPTGVQMAWGRCWEAGGAPAFWPWIQSLRTVVRDLGPEQTRQAASEHADELAQLLPEVGPDKAVHSPTSASDAESARFRLFEAVSSFVAHAAEERPILLVIDDLQAADEPSLLLLRFLASTIGDMRLAVFGTHRDVEAEHPLSVTLEELAREPSVERVRLRGLSRSEVGRFIEATVGAVPPAALVAEVHRRTEGNPLFVGELARLLASPAAFEAAASDPAGLAVPRGVRDAIARRLGRLSPESRRVLSVASILGREVGLEAIGDMERDAGSDAVMLLEEAIHAGILAEIPGSPGRVRFSHALVRDAVYDEIPPTRRPALHARAAEALARRHAGHLGPHLAEIAHHHLLSTPAEDPAEAISWARRAGNWALSHLAYEEAVRLFASALRVLGDSGGGDSSLHCDLLLELGEARVRAGDDPGAKEAFLVAAELARSLGDPERLARAALGYGGRFVWLRPGGDPRIVPLLQEALTALPQTDSGVRVRVLSRLAGALRDDPDRKPRDGLSREAVAMARRIGDPATLAYALPARYTAIWAPDNSHELLEIATELVEHADRMGDVDALLEGTLILHKALMTLGDVDAAERELERAARLAEGSGQPSQLWYPLTDRSALALFRGNFEEAESLIPQVLQVGERALGRMEGQVPYRLQLYELRRSQGRLGEAAAPIRRAVNEFPGYAMFRAVAASVAAELGERSEARRLFAEMARNDFEWLPFDNEWLFGMSFLPEVARFVGDTAGAAVLYDKLLPYAGLNAYSPPELCTGPVSRPLGILAATLGHVEEAVAHLDEALESTQRMGARPWRARTLVDQSRVFGNLGQADRAAELLAEAAETARQIGMYQILATVAELREGGTVVPLRAPQTTSASVFRRDGDVWSIAFEARVIRLRDSKGLRYLHRLLEAQGRELHVAELASPGSDPRGGRRTEGLTPDTGHAGQIIDPQARSAYAHRIKELEDEAEEATRWADTERAARARMEIEAITEQLAEAYGLGGRARRAGDNVERMRKAVTNRIRDALARIDREHPSLGKHLANTVATGVFCSYSPERPMRWSL